MADTSPMAAVATTRCLGRITTRKRGRDGEVQTDRTIQCSKMVDPLEKTGRFCANCLVPSAKVAFDAEAGAIHYADLLLEILKNTSTHELVYVRDDPVLRVFADYVLAKRGYDGEYLIHTWNGAVYDLNRLAAMMEQARQAHRAEEAAMEAEGGGILNRRWDAPRPATYPPHPGVGSRVPAANSAVTAAVEESRIEALDYIMSQDDDYDYEHFGIYHVEMIGSRGDVKLLNWSIRYFESIGIEKSHVLHAAARGASTGGQPNLLHLLYASGWRPSDQIIFELIVNAGIHNQISAMRVLVGGMYTFNPRVVSSYNMNICYNLRNYTPAMEWLHAGDDPDHYPCMGACEYALRIAAAQQPE